MFVMIFLILHTSFSAAITASGVEWAGYYTGPHQALSWTFRKVGGSYADADILIVAVPSNAMNMEDADVNQLMRGTCIDVQPTKASNVSIDTSALVCYKVHFDTTTESTSIDVAMGANGVTFFTNHNPGEFQEYEASVGIVDDSGIPLAYTMAKHFASTHGHRNDHSHDPMAQDHDHELVQEAFTLSVVSCVASTLNLAIICIVGIIRITSRRLFHSGLIGIQMDV